MPQPGGPPAYVGVSLRMVGASAVVLREGAALAVPGAYPPDHVDTIVADVIRLAGPARVEAVTLDLSGLLLSQILSRSTPVAPLAAVRIVPRAASDPGLARSPARSVERLIGRRFTVPGGHDLLGNELRPLDLPALGAMCAELADADVRQVAIVGSGSQRRPDHERAVADAVQAAVPGAQISVASDFGGRGLVAREATVVLDCALRPPAYAVLDAWEKALQLADPRIALRVGRGDGGYSTPARVRTLPVVVLGARDALEIGGAASLAGLRDCRVVLPRPDGWVAGHVRHGLTTVRSGEFAGIGTELVVPTAALTPESDDSGQHHRRLADEPVIVAEQDPELLAGVGAALSRPTAWLDEIAYIESADELERVRRDAEDRATGIVMANGAAAGSAYLAEVSTVGVPYSPSGMIRIRVRVAGAPDTGPAEHWT